MKEILQQNGYPEQFLLPHCSPSRQASENDPRSYATIPYIQGVSESVTRISANIDVKVYMRPTSMIRSILSHPKDRVPDDEKSDVIYKISCGDCDASYVGQTGRALKTRLTEHQKAVRNADFSSSALAQHAWDNSHRIDWTSICVLGSEPRLPSRLSREAIHIRRQSTPLNRDRGSLPDVYDFLIKTASYD